MRVISHILLTWYYVQNSYLFVIGDTDDRSNKQSYSINNNTFMSDMLTRHSRFLSFNTDSSSIKVDVVFSLPLLTVPTGGNAIIDEHEETDPSKININLKSIIIIAGILLILLFIVPMITKAHQPYTPYSRLGEIPSKFEAIMSQINDTLNIDMETCVQKIICLMMNHIAQEVKYGNANGIEKIINGFASMMPLKNHVSDIWKWNFFEDATNASKSIKNSCEIFDDKCPITLTKLTDALLKLLTTLRNKIHFKKSDL